MANWQIKAFYYKIAYSWQPNSWPVVQIPTQINKRIPYPCIFFKLALLCKNCLFAFLWIASEWNIITTYRHQKSEGEGEGKQYRKKLVDIYMIDVKTVWLVFCLMFTYWKIKRQEREHANLLENGHKNLIYCGNDRLWS